MKRPVIVALVALVVAVVLVVAWIFGRRESAGAAGAPCRILAILPLTGPAAQYGKYALQGMTLAQKDLGGENQGGPQGSVQVVFEDSKSEPKEAVTIAKKYTALNRVPVILTLTTAETSALAPLCEQSHTVMVSASVAPGVADLGEYVFRNAGNLAWDAEAMADMCVGGMGLKRVAVLALNMPALREIRDVFGKRLAMGGGQLVATEWGNKGDTDFRVQLAKLKEQAPEAVYLLGYVEVAYMLKQAKEIGFTPQFLGDPSMESPKVIEIAGPAAEGVVYTRAAFDAAGGDAHVKAFAAAYQDAYGTPPEVFAAQAYDTLRIIARVVKGQGHAADAIRTGLLAVQDYPGVSGKTSFLRNGDVVKPLAFRTIKDAQFVPFTR